MTTLQCPRCGSVLDLEYDSTFSLEEDDIHAQGQGEASGYCQQCVTSWKIDIYYTEDTP